MVNSFQFTKSARLILVTDGHGAVLAADANSDTQTATSGSGFQEQEPLRDRRGSVGVAGVMEL